ncbi:MAG TPA: ArgE/DapE family deacylase [bacterium]|nr:ArgE/DapE family deacylase [bacterium]
MTVPVPPRVRPEAVVELVERLVAVPSVNPLLVPGGSGEAEIAETLAGACRALDLEVSVDEALPGRPNVVAVLRGSDPGRGRSLLLNGHTDTVGAAGMEAPFSPVRRGDRLFGRGAYDMKASLAAMVGAVAAFREAGAVPLADVILTFAVDEEYLSAGTEAIARRYRADGAIVTEPTAMRLCLAHKGFVWARIRTEGRAAHGSDPVAGVDAIAHMGRVLAAIDRLDREVLPRTVHPLVGRPSLHASLIQGGEGLSTYPPACTLDVERRTLPGETRDGVERELTAIVDGLRAEDPALQATVEITGSRPGLEVRPDAPIVRALESACRHVTGRRPPHIGVAYWCDAALLAQRGVPTVVFGPSGEGAHAAVEYVDLPSVVGCAQVFAATIGAFCGTGDAPADVSL